MFIVTRQTGMTPANAVYLSLKAFASVRLTPAATSTVAFNEPLSTTQRLSLNGRATSSYVETSVIWRCYVPLRSRRRRPWRFYLPRRSRRRRAWLDNVNVWRCYVTLRSRQRRAWRCYLTHRSRRKRAWLDNVNVWRFYVTLRSRQRRAWRC